MNNLMHASTAANKDVTGIFMDVDPESGENLEKLVTKTMNQPADVIARVKKLLGN